MSEVSLEITLKWGARVPPGSIVAIALTGELFRIESGSIACSIMASGT